MREPLKPSETLGTSESGERLPVSAWLTESEANKARAAGEAAVALGLCIDESAAAFDEFFADVEVS